MDEKKKFRFRNNLTPFYKLPQNIMAPWQALEFGSYMHSTYKIATIPRYIFCRIRPSVCNPYVLTVFPRIISAETIWKLFFFEIVKCGNFYIVSALWQFFINWIVATETIERGKLFKGKKLFAEVRYLIFFGQDLENSNHSGMLQPGLATTLIIIHLTH